MWLSAGEVVRAYVLAGVIKSLLFGMYVATFLHCLRWLLFDDKEWKLREHPNVRILVISSLIFLLSVSDLAVSFRTVLNAYLHGFQYSAYDAATFVVESFTTMLADGVLIYRCWVVYGRKWYIVYLPILLWLGGLGCLTMYIYAASRIQTKLQSSAFQLTDHATQAFFACTIALNVYATTVIVLRIWKVARQAVYPNSAKGLRFTTRVIAESGLLYGLTSIMVLVAYIPSSRAAALAQLICSAINFPTIGIAYNLIIIRVAQQRVAKEQSTNVDSSDTIDHGIAAV